MTVSPTARHDPITERGIDYPRSTVVEVWDGTPTANGWHCH